MKVKLFGVHDNYTLYSDKITAFTDIPMWYVHITQDFVGGPMTEDVV